MATIEKRRMQNGKVRYRARVKYKGRALTSTHLTRQEAERWAASASVTIRDELHFVAGTNSRRFMRDLIERYVEHVLPLKGNPKNQQLHLQWWLARIGNLTVDKVTRAVIAKYRDELLMPGADGRKRSPATVVRYLASISHVFTVAINDWEWAAVNPVRGIRKPKEPPGRVRYLSDAERERLLTVCQSSSSPDLYAVVILALSTGMRRGEVMSLTWKEVDLKSMVITLRKTKNGLQRTVPLTAKALEELSKRQSARRLDTDLVFPGAVATGVGSTHASPKDIKKAWETARRKAGLEDFRFHDLRHSAASYLAMSGASTLEIAALLGHQQLQMTKRYAHLSVDHLRGVVGRALNDRLTLSGPVDSVSAEEVNSA